MIIVIRFIRNDGKVLYMQAEEYRTKTVKVLHCNRCNKEWEQRYPDILPKTCRWCKSPYWNKARKHNVEVKTCKTEKKDLKKF